MICFAYSIVFWLAVASRCFAQDVLPQVSFLPAQPCDSVATNDQEAAEQTAAVEIERLLADLPRGREQEIALELLEEVSLRRLPGFCRDPQTGDFVADSVRVTGRESREFRVALGNRSRLQIELDVDARVESGAFDYVYRGSNGSDAGAPITTWGLMTLTADRTKSMTHPVWQVGHTARSARVVEVIAREGTQAVIGPMLGTGGSELSRWSAASDRFEIQAGSSLSLFAVRSAFGPGWTTAYVGSDDTIEIPEQPLPDSVKAGLEVLSRPEHFYTTVHTIGPKYPPGTDRTWIAGDWHLGVQIMTAAGQLSAGSPYIAELLGVLALIGGTAPEAQVPLKVGTPPKGAAETVVDKAVRMALR